jgi:uncharacterized membrane protein
MNGPGTESPQRDDTGLERLLFFSDAVFAIAITLLVLDIKVPEPAAAGSAAALGRALWELIPKFFAFVVSFGAIGYCWFMHHTMFRYVRRCDDGLIGTNLLLLLVVAFLPFPVALFGSFRHQAPAVIFYACSLAATGLFQSRMWWYATRGRRLVDPGLDRHTVRLLHLQMLAVPAVLAVSIPLNFVNPTWSVLCWILVVPALRIVTRRMRRQAAAATAEN